MNGRPNVHKSSERMVGQGDAQTGYSHSPNHKFLLFRTSKLGSGRSRSLSPVLSSRITLIMVQSYTLEKEL